MRAYHGALVALDALGTLPLGHVYSDAALLEGGGPGREAAVLAADEGAHGQAVALLRVDRRALLRGELRDLRGHPTLLHHLVRGVEPGRRDLDLDDVVQPGVDRGVVHLYDVLALLAVGLLDGVLHVLHGVLDRDDVRQLEERGLHDRVGAVAQPQLLRLVHGVDDVELRFLLCELALELGGKVLLELLERRPLSVEQERPALLEPGRDMVLVHVLLFVAGDEVGRVDEIGGLDRGLAETQM